MDENEEVIAKTDEELAKSIRARMLHLLGVACDVMNEAKTHNITVQFGIAPNAEGLFTVSAMTLVKTL